MLEAMVQGDARFTVDRLEIDRAGLSYTVDTLTEYTRRHPGDRLFFLIGSDLIAELPRWRDARRIAELADLVVLDRGKTEGAAALEEPAREASFNFTRIATRRVDVSSTEIRSRVSEDKPIAGFVTDAVARYIEVTALYR
jgi:nicotinate-nucleotide adenylyltransferase